MVPESPHFPRGNTIIPERTYALCMECWCIGTMEYWERTELLCFIALPPPFHYCSINSENHRFLRLPICCTMVWQTIRIIAPTFPDEKPPSQDESENSSVTTIADPTRILRNIPRQKTAEVSMSTPNTPLDRYRLIFSIVSR